MRVAFVLSTLLAGLATAKLSDTQISSVFPDSTELYGSDASFPKAFDASFVANSTHLLAVLTPTGSAEVGWIGLGSGSAMVGSDMLIMWPNAGKWVLSHGVATSTVSPKDTGSDPEEYSLVDSLSTTTSVAFLRKMDSVFKLAKQPVIFARASENPGSSDPSVTKSYHDVAYASASLDLSAKIAAPKAAAVPETPASKAQPPAAKSSVEAPAPKIAPSEPAPKPASPPEPSKPMPEPSSPPPPPMMSSSLRHRPNHKTHIYPRPRSSHASLASGIRRKKKKMSSASESGVFSAAGGGEKVKETPIVSMSMMPKVSSAGAAQLDMNTASSSGFSIAESQMSDARINLASCFLVLFTSFAMLLLL